MANRLSQEPCHGFTPLVGIQWRCYPSCMDAKTFITKKHDGAVEELKVIEAEYMAKKEAAQAAIDMAKKWLAELGTEPAKPEPQVAAQDCAKSSSENWVSARDLASQGRLNGN